MKQICILFLAGLLGVAASIGGSGNLLAQDCQTMIDAVRDSRNLVAQDCQTMIDEMDARLGTGVNLDGEVATGGAAGLDGGTAGLDGGASDPADSGRPENAVAGLADLDSAPVNWGLAIVILVAVAVALVLAGKGVIALRRCRDRAAEND